MNYKFERLLEAAIKNKIFLILLAMSIGIAIRFKDDIMSIFTCVCTTSIFYGMHRFFLWSHALGMISYDLRVLADKIVVKEKKFIFSLLFSVISMVAAYVMAGYTVASVRFHYMTPEQQINSQLDEIYIIGKVTQIENRDIGVRIYLDEVHESNRFQDVLDEIAIGSVRINLRYSCGNIIGKWVFLRTTLMPPPSPAFPNSFDFAQHAFFKGIGAIGYALQRPVVVPELEMHPSVLDRLAQQLTLLQKKVTQRIKNAIPDPAAGIASAILVGENSQINSNDYYALRVSGLAHIIAISGMHVVVVVAIAFFFVRAILLYLVPLLTNFQVALYFSISKASAIFSIILSTFYVLLAGAPISAQRALISSAIVMWCTVSNKRLNSIKSLCLAAVIMLVVTPEVLFSPGLQMSFAACFALIKTFAVLDQIMRIRSKYLEYFLKLIAASAAASAATAPFIIYHFNQFAPYGILANLICVPLSDFVIMPLGMMSMLLMPLQLEQYPLLVVGYSIDFMLWLAHKICRIPLADIHCAGFTNSGMAIIAVGLFIFCISSTKAWHFLAVVLFSLGCQMKVKNDNIFLIVSPKTFAVRYDTISNINDKLFVFSSRQRDKFAHEVWKGKLGAQQFLSKSLSSLKGIDCKAKLCVLLQPFSVIIINRPWDEEVQKLCEAKQPKVFINMYDDETCAAAKTSITAKDLEAHGTHVLFHSDPMKILTSKN